MWCILLFINLININVSENVRIGLPAGWKEGVGEEGCRLFFFSFFTCSIYFLFLKHHYFQVQHYSSWQLQLPHKNHAAFMFKFSRMTGLWDSSWNVNSYRNRVPKANNCFPARYNCVVICMLNRWQIGWKVAWINCMVMYRFNWFGTLKCMLQQGNFDNPN